ncbi:hypothetical protein BLNAU_16304 [Blattamonas nauphoetae]|uniref:Protein kinase domain-containing protein n=1 Tax=Blattamonas nauphoetae TaxID=2049346 RepID=A0ABQ9XAP8_9EUKA|nr:hypothetical protein BLNAU_16304 [Blattamonas nauphoetae]
MTSEEAELEATQTKQQVGGLEGNATVPNVPKDVEQAGMDGLRWRAPEVVAGGGSAVDGQKASVFSLGLVLWEIETGQVPFGELDAVNAQRQSGTGIGPKMESLKNEEFIALIHRCVSVDPKQRPSLSEIGEFLSSHPEESNMHFHNDMKDQTQESTRHLFTPSINESVTHRSFQSASLFANSLSAFEAVSHPLQIIPRVD